MTYIQQQNYGKKILQICSLFSSYNQKKILLSIYTHQKTKKNFKEVSKIYENWFVTHNINV